MVIILIDIILYEIYIFQALELPVYPEKQASLSRSTSGSDLRQITVLERLTKTHPIWFLPQVGRSGAVHLLKNRDTGVSFLITILWNQS